MRGICVLFCYCVFDEGVGAVDVHAEGLGERGQNGDEGETVVRRDAGVRCMAMVR